MRNITGWGFSVLLIACSSTSESQKTTDKFLAAEQLGLMKDSALKEVSGLSASRINKGLLWAVNDSGNKPQVYLLDKDLNITLTCTLKGVKNRDWEDIAVGPGPDNTKTYIYVADIGDNDANNNYKHIYRFEEPKAGGSDEMDITDFATITFKLPGKIKDTETLLIDPLTKDLYVVSKREKPVYLYRVSYPQSTTEKIIATEVMSLPFTKIVAGDISPDGSELLLKDYGNIYYWSNPRHGDWEDVLREDAQEVAYKKEPQGESIGFAADGTGFYTLSEKSGKSDSYLYFYGRNVDAR